MGMQRCTFQRGELTLSFLDSQVPAPVLVALHAHLMEARTYEPLAAALAPQWRVVALDQRGHGDSSHASTYSRSDYLADVATLLAHLGLSQAVLLGNSLGGVNAYQFAAAHPDQVRAIIVEDIGAVVSDDIRFILAWAGVFPTRQELEARIDSRFLPYFQDSFRHTSAGWSLAFDPHDMVLSQQNLVGDHWDDWLASTCPALLLRGSESRVTSPVQVEQMASRRPNTTLLTLNGGHTLHVDNPSAFNQAVRDFLQNLPAQSRAAPASKTS